MSCSWIKSPMVSQASWSRASDTSNAVWPTHECIWYSGTSWTHRALRSTSGSGMAMTTSFTALSSEQKQAIRGTADSREGLRVIEFTDGLLSYMNAADVVISMAGYNTICELLTLGKRSIVVPRVKPVEEQKIRAERLAGLGAFRMILPGDLTPQTL